MSPSLPIPDRLRFGIVLLVVGTGILGYQTAAMAEMERDPSPSAEPAGRTARRTE